MARPTLTLIAAGLGGWLLASTAFAATQADVPAIHVKFAELDLAKDAGIERLYARLRSAAQQVCGRADNRDLAAQAEQQDCMHRALDRAVNDVHSARLTARHKGAAAGAQYARLN